MVIVVPRGTRKALRDCLHFVRYTTLRFGHFLFDDFHKNHHKHMNSYMRTTRKEAELWNFSAAASFFLKTTVFRLSSSYTDSTEHLGVP